MTGPAPERINEHIEQCVPVSLVGVRCSLLGVVNLLFRAVALWLSHAGDFHAKDSSSQKQSLSFSSAHLH